MGVVVPAPHDFPDGVSTSSEMNAYVRDPLNFLLNKPMCMLRAPTNAQTLTNNVLTALLFDEELYDPYDGHSTSTNTSRYYARYAGWYQLSGGTGFVANTTNRRNNDWAVNGVAVTGSGVYLSATPTGSCETPSRTIMAHLNIGDYVEFFAMQDSGGNLATSITTDTAASMTIMWVSR